MKGGDKVDLLAPLKKAIGSVKSAVADPLIMMILGFISNAIEYYESQEKSDVADAIFDIILYSILRMETQLRALAQQSSNNLDDKIVDELIEAANHIREEGGLELPS